MESESEAEKVNKSVHRQGREWWWGFEGGGGEDVGTVSQDALSRQGRLLSHCGCPTTAEVVT